MQINYLALTFFFVVLAFAYWLHSRIKYFPTLGVSTQAPFQKRKSYRLILYRLTPWFFWAACTFLIIAISDPRSVKEVSSEKELFKSELPREGVAIYFLLDESGSMSERVRGGIKIDIAKRAIEEFIQEKRKDDLIGLIGFARVPEVLCPLTLNRSEVIAKLDAITPIKQKVRNGTAIGYAIFKAVNIIVSTKYFAQRQKDKHKSVYSIENQALIIITDGLQSPNPADKDNPFRFMPPDEAIKYAQDNGVRVFYIGIDPILEQSEFSKDIREMREAMQKTGGDLFLADSRFPVDRILKEIDEMQKSAYAPRPVFAEKPVHERSLVWLFLMLSMGFLGVGILFETTFARSIP